MWSCRRSTPPSNWAERKGAAMSVLMRTVLAVAALAVYAYLGFRKALRIRQRLRSPERKILRFELTRLELDCIVLEFFLLSGLCPMWFSQFPGTMPGISLAVMVLISITLVISVAVDWCRLCLAWQLQGKGKPPPGPFLAKQATNMLMIHGAMAIVWGVIQVLEPSRADAGIRLGIAAMALIAIRVAAEGIRYLKEKKRSPVGNTGGETGRKDNGRE